MKFFFSPRGSKYNVLMTLCALSVTISSLPVTAVAQEACVRTSAGDVVCGKPVPKPNSNPTRADSNVTIDTQVHESVTWELKSCVRKARNVVSCTLSLSTSLDRQYGMLLNNNINLVDSSGNEYYANRFQIGNRSAVANNRLWVNLVKGARYKTIINFTDVPTSISQVTLFQVDNAGYGSPVVKFRNVPIN